MEVITMQYGRISTEALMMVGLLFIAVSFLFVGILIRRKMYKGRATITELEIITVKSHAAGEGYREGNWACLVFYYNGNQYKLKRRAWNDAKKGDTIVFNINNPYKHYIEGDKEYNKLAIGFFIVGIIFMIGTTII
jgi:hypothetical protein